MSRYSRRNYLTSLERAAVRELLLGSRTSAQLDEPILASSYLPLGLLSGPYDGFAGKMV